MLNPVGQRFLRAPLVIIEWHGPILRETEPATCDEVAASAFSYSDVISATNLELIANLSGCEAHRSMRLEAESACEQDLCFHSKFRQGG